MGLKIRIKTLIILLLGFGLLQSCVEKEEYPPEPIIEFVSFTTFRTQADIDTMGIITFSYTDGDGDLGVYNCDYFPTNLYTSYYKMDNGELKIGTVLNPSTGELDTINFNACFEQLAPKDYSGWIKGEFEDTIRFLRDITSTKPYDTVMFETYISDRSGNKSNIIQTPLIIVKNQ